MNKTLQDLVRKVLCPDGIWQPTNIIKSVLKYQISRLPKAKVEDIEIRLPQNAPLMRAFLIKFFTRHYFQIQNSLIDYMTSQGFLNAAKSGRLQILDVGCGPAVACCFCVSWNATRPRRYTPHSRLPAGRVSFTNDGVYIKFKICMRCIGTCYERNLADGSAADPGTARDVGAPV